MRPIRSFTLFLAGFAIAGVPFTGLDRALSDEDEFRAGPSAAEQAAEQAAQRAYEQLVSRVKRATLTEGTRPEFQLVVVATEAGLYIENPGHLDVEDGAILGRKLHALGDLVGAPAEIEAVLEELEEELEEEMEDEDEDEDDDDDEPLEEVR